MGYLHQATKEGQGTGPSPGSGSPHCWAVSAVLSTAQSCPTTTRSLSNNAWSHFSNYQGPFLIHVLDGPPCWGGRGRGFMVKSHDVPAGLEQRAVSRAILFISVEVIMNTTIHLAQQSSQNGHCLLLGLP